MCDFHKRTWRRPGWALVERKVHTGAGRLLSHRHTIFMKSLVLRRLGIAVVSVKIATVDALYRETPSDVQCWVGLGAQAINMETAPLYAAASMCGVRAVWLGHISDTLWLTTQTWDSWQRPAAMTDITVALTIGFLERSA